VVRVWGQALRFQVCAPHIRSSSTFSLSCSASAPSRGAWGLKFGIWGLGFGVWGLRFGVWGLGVGVWGLGFGVQGLGFGVRGVGFKVKIQGLSVQACTAHASGGLIPRCCNPPYAFMLSATATHSRSERRSQPKDQIPCVHSKNVYTIELWKLVWF